MALVWQIKLVRLDEAIEEESGVGQWEPFAVIWDNEEDTHLLVVRRLAELEGERSSTLPENRVIWTPPDE